MLFPEERFKKVIIDGEIFEEVIFYEEDLDSEIFGKSSFEEVIFDEEILDSEIFYRDGFNEMNLDEEIFNGEIYVPRPSATQQKVYDGLYRRCYDDIRFEGPGLELRCGRCSLDIYFFGRNGEKICYEIDCTKFHCKIYDKKRDYFLKKTYGWKTFRIDVVCIDKFGFEKIADMIYQHLLVHLGLSSVLIYPTIITSFYEGNIH